DVAVRAYHQGLLLDYAAAFEVVDSARFEIVLMILLPHRQTFGDVIESLNAERADGAVFRHFEGEINLALQSGGQRVKEAYGRVVLRERGDNRSLNAVVLDNAVEDAGFVFRIWNFRAVGPQRHRALSEQDRVDGTWRHRRFGGAGGHSGAGETAEAASSRVDSLCASRRGLLHLSQQLVRARFAEAARAVFHPPERQHPQRREQIAPTEPSCEAARFDFFLIGVERILENLFGVERFTVFIIESELAVDFQIGLLHLVRQGLRRDMFQIVIEDRDQLPPHPARILEKRELIADLTPDAIVPYSGTVEPERTACVIITERHARPLQPPRKRIKLGPLPL